MDSRRLLVLSLALGVLALGCATSPTGRMQLITQSPQAMSQMGLAAFEQMKAERPLSSNRAQRRYVQCVADAITGILTPEDMRMVVVERWETQLFDDASANAFALPGGRMGVHTGLLNVASTPDQLATVMGHEVAHVIGRHGAERISSSQFANLGMILAEGWASADPESREKWLQAMGVGVQLGMLKYSRTHESEADILGLAYMARAGFDPREAVTLWQNMARAAQGPSPPEFLSTHPSHSTRIRDLQAATPGALRLYEAARASGRRPNCR